MSNFNEAERRFLIGLEKLTRETGIIIGGCGCCGSPFLTECSPEKLAPEEGYGASQTSDVAWIDLGCYDWETCKHTIVKEEAPE